MATFDAGKIEATASLDRTPFQRSLEAAIREGKSFDGRVFTAIADIDHRQVDRKLNLAQAKLDQFARKKYTASIDADRSGVTRAVDAAARDLDRVGGGRGVQLRADLDNGPVLQKLQEIEQAANRTADSIGSGFTSRFQKIKFTSIFAGITLGAAAAGPLLTGLAGGFGATIVSAHGLGDALKAYAKDQKDADKVTAQGASTARSNATALRNAAEAVGDARRAAGRSAEDSAERVSQASKNEVRAAADVVEAQKAIAAARREATRALEDAQEKVNDFALDLNGAIIAEKRAEEDRKKVFEDGTSTDLDKAEAQQRLAEAEERVRDLLDENRRNVEDLNELQAKGVEGSDQVTNAKKQQADAEQRLVDAMHESDLAHRDAQRAQEDAARNIARAIQNLKDVQDQQAEAAAAAAAKNDAFADAMDKLSPAGQRLVKVLLSLKDNYDRLTGETQAAVFPGLMRMLDALPSIEPAVTGGFKAIGGAISDVGDDAAEMIKNPLFQGQLQQSLENAAPIVRGVGDTVLDLMADMVKFGATSQPIVEGTVDAFGSLEDGVDRFFTNIQPQSRAAGQTISSFGQIVEDVLGGAGTITGQFFDEWAQARSHIEPVVREVIDVLSEFTGGGFSAFGDDMKIVLDVFNGALHVIEPVARLLGGVAGDILAANVAFKLFAGPLGKVVDLYAKFRPVNIAASITGALPGFMRAGVEVDKTTGAIKRNTDGLSKSQVAWGKVGGKVADAGKYIPLIGLAIAGVSEYIDQTVPDLDDLAQGMLDGGQAAATAAGSFREVRGAGVGFGDALRDIFGPSMDETAAKARELYRNMTPLQKAQQDNTKASNDYQYALKNFGDQSIVTREAAEKYRTTTLDLKQAQYDAEQATKSHTEKIRDQQDAMLASAGGQLAYDRAQVRVKETQAALTAAIKEHGATSKEAQDAEFEYRQALIDSVTAAQSLSDANTALLSPQDQLNARVKATTDQLILLATQSGTALPPELQSMINKMDDSALAAYGVSVKVDDMGNKILSLPPGKELHFPTDAKQATDAMYGLGDAIGYVDRSYQGWMQSYINLITTMVNNPVPDAGTGLGTPAGFGFLGHKAYGGNFAIGQPTVVGEQGPELVFPDRAAFVATAAQSKAILNGVALASNGATRTDNSDVVGALYALMGMFAAGVRAEFDSGSLETGLIRAQRRRDSR
jgi:hypothetical protein